MDLPETPADALGPTVRETVVVEGRSFILTRPDAVDRLIDHPVLGAATAADEYMPYWADLWPAARLLASAVLREPWPRTEPPLQALEIGCGLGLPGVAALAAGLQVIFSDYDATSLRFAADNARINGFDRFRTLQMDWRHPPPELHVPVLLASDVVYQVEMTAPLALLIRQLLTPDGVCLLTDSDRTPAPALRQALVEHGLTFTAEAMNMGASQRPARGTLYRIRHPYPAL